MQWLCLPAVLLDFGCRLRPACTQCQRQSAGCLVWVSSFRGTAAGIGRVRTSWGSTQEAGALYGLMGHLPSSSQLEEIGLCYLDPDSPVLAGMGFAAGTLPPLGASPDGLLRHKPVPISSPEPEQLPLPSAPLMATLPATGLGPQSSPSALPVAVPHSSSIPAKAMLQTPLDLQHAWAVRPSSIPPHESWCEVVEIKNVSPFRQILRTNHKGQVSISYVVSDNGPYQSVSPCMACTAFMVPAQGWQTVDLPVGSAGPNILDSTAAAGDACSWGLLRPCRFTLSNSGNVLMQQSSLQSLRPSHSTPCCPAACFLQSSIS